MNEVVRNTHIPHSNSDVIEEYRGDEIDLFDLLDDIVKNKVWLLVGVLCTLCLAAIYLVTTKPIYEVGVVLKPAAEKDLLELNAPQLGGIYSMDVAGAYGSVKRHLSSRDIRQDFYVANHERISAVVGLYNSELSQEQNFSLFNSFFSVSVSGKKDVEEFVRVDLEMWDPVLVANLLNDYVAYSLLQSKQEVIDTLESKVAAKIKSLEYDAMLLREKYYSSQTRRKLQLEEAHGVAEAIGQTDPVYIKSDILGSYQPPLYMFGTKAISAEEKAITNRKVVAKSLPHGEDHFIAGLPEVLFKIDQLKKLQIDFDKVALAVIDESAVPPLSPSKPKKLLILALATIAGLFSGLMAALLSAAYKRRKLAAI